MIFWKKDLVRKLEKKFDYTKSAAFARRISGATFIIVIVLLSFVISFDQNIQYGAVNTIIFIQIFSPLQRNLFFSFYVLLSIKDN